MESIFILLAAHLSRVELLDGFNCRLLDEAFGVDDSCGVDVLTLGDNALRMA